MLYLTLYKKYFDEILRGEKRIEYRRRSPRYDKQFEKQYSSVKFVNGYGNHRPWLIAEIDRFEKTDSQWLIHLGSVIDSGNIKPSLFS